MTELDIEIPRDPGAPRKARRAIERFASHVAPDRTTELSLLVSELVTNSVKYGAEGDVHLRLGSLHPDHVRVEVVDHGCGFAPAARDRPVTVPGGWGLHLVETLADRWGVQDGSARVWFELGTA